MKLTFALPLLIAASALAHDGNDAPVLYAAANAGGGSNVRTFTSKVTITVRDDKRVIEANGIPDHTPGQFPRRGNPNTISEQKYNFTLPAKPQIAAQPSPARGWFGVAINGVPFEAGTAEVWGEGWRYEAIGGSMNLGLDEHLAHVQPTGAYHYHSLPTGLIEKLGGDGKRMLHIGWAGDGFPIYTSYAYADAKDAKSALKKMRSSYQLKKGTRPGSPDGPGGKYDGAFTADFEFVKGSGELDECNGRFGVTPEFPQGTYYYCITAEFPFASRQWRGTPDQSFMKRGPGPGGPGGPGGKGKGKGGPPGQRKGPPDGRPPGSPPQG